MVVCPNCGNKAGAGAAFCDQCGSRLPASQPAAPAPEPAAMSTAGSMICPACGAGNVPGEAFCDFCGSPLEAPVPTADMVPALEPVSTEAELVADVAPPAEAAAPAEPAVAGAEEAAAEARLTCPACGAEVIPGEAFCANCGASLAEAPLPPEPVPDTEVELGPLPPVEALPPEPEKELVPEAAAPVPMVEEVAVLPPTPLAAPSCPVCGQPVEPGDKFCSNCGAALLPAVAPEAVPPAPVQPPVPAAAPAGPRLVVVASGAEIPLPARDEILIGREDPVSGIFPDVDLTPHGGEVGGVSRRHARLTVEGGTTYITDLDSTNYTFVNKQKLTPGSRVAFKDGDEIRCGRVALVFRA